MGRKERDLHFKTLTDSTFVSQVKKNEGTILMFGASPSKHSLGTERSKRERKALVPVCNRQAGQNTEQKRKTALLLVISKVLLKAACWTWKEQDQKQGLSTFGMSENVTVPPPTSAEGCYYTQRRLNSMKDISWLNGTLNHFSFSPQMQNRSPHLPFEPERSRSTTGGDTATGELTLVLKN